MISIVLQSQDKPDCFAALPDVWSHSAELESVELSRAQIFMLEINGPDISWKPSKPSNLHGWKLRKIELTLA